METPESFDLAIDLERPSLRVIFLANGGSMVRAALRALLPHVPVQPVNFVDVSRH